MEKPQVYRSGFGTALAWTWVALAAVFLADIAWRGRDLDSLVAASVLLLIAGVAYVTGIRPRIVAAEDGVRLCNPLRDIRVPWGEVDRVDVTDAVRVHSGGTHHRAWVLHVSPRARAKAQRGDGAGGAVRAGAGSGRPAGLAAERDGDRVPASVAEYLRGRTHADFAAEQLTELADAHRRRESKAGRAGPPERGEKGEGAVTASVTWSWPALAALVVPAVLCAVTISATLAG